MLIKTLDVSDTLFSYYNLSSSAVKLSRESVKLNFPFLPGSDFFYIQDRENLYIWSSNGNGSKYSIPSSYFLYLALKKNEGIHIFENKYVFVVKSGTLEEQLVLSSASRVELLSYQYELDIINYDKNEKEILIKEGKSTLSFSNYVDIFRNFIDFNYKKVNYETVINKIALPSLLFVGVVFIFLTLFSFRLESQYGDSLKKYRELKEKNREIKKLVAKSDKNYQKLEEIKDELNGQLNVSHYNDLIASLNKEDILTQITINKERFRIKVSTKESLKLLKRINSSSKFERVKIKVSNKDKKNSGYKFIIIEGSIK